VLSFLTKPNHEDYSKNLGHPWEEYNPAYFNKFQSIQNIINYADSCVGIQQRNTVAYYDFIAQIIRKRFYHGYSHYYFSDNPLAYLSGHFIWDHLSAIVLPEDIMKHPMAACSQQSIVLAEIFKRNNIDYRKVSFRNHFAMESFIQNQWHYFDTNMEPKLSKRESLASLLSENKLIEAYTSTGLDINYLHRVLDAPKTGETNENFAPNASFFHQACFFLTSKWFLFIVIILTFWKNIRGKVLRKFFKKQEEKKIETESSLAMAS
jgi:hypothetical protein